MSAEILHYGANERKAIMLSKLGGNEVLRKAIDIFYEKQLHDDELMKFFQGINVDIIKWHQFNLMSIAFTAVPSNFDVVDLILTRHERLFDEGLSEQHFDRVMKHFRDTLEELNVEEELMEEAVDVVMPLRMVFQQGAEESAKRKRKFEWEHKVAMGAIVAIVAAVAVKLVLSRKKK
jgi:truncated hemoglobin YjbI